MKNLIPYKVTYKTGPVFCANIAMAESKQSVEDYYTAKYGWCYVCDCTAWELENARRKGCPVVTIR